jgi:hypothetical protein
MRSAHIAWAAWVSLALLTCCTGSGSSSVGPKRGGKDAACDPTTRADLADDFDGGTAGDPSCASADASAPLPVLSPAKVVGILVGPEAAHSVGDLHLYGTDLGFTFEHDDQLFVMFGDTLPTPDDICNNRPNDDTLATMPKPYSGGVPELTFRANPDVPHDFKRLHLIRNEKSLDLGFGKAPTTAFSDGKRVYAVFDRLELTRCAGNKSSVDARCPIDDGFACSKGIGECQPSYDGVVPPLCDLKTQAGCFPGQKCTPASTPLCVDRTSSQYNCTIGGEIAATAQNTELGVQRLDDPDTFDSVLVLPTNKFISVSARAVAHVGDGCDGNDYRPGHGQLLLWGRPRYVAEGGREAELYLMVHDLPLTLDDAGALKFQPRYFAGVDPSTGAPRWSASQSHAKPLAMDGKVGGDPHEPVHIVNHTAISWLGPPIDKWVMLYGGSLSDYLLTDPAGSQYAPAPGAIMVRFADHPWGPWSPPVAHLSPGDPNKRGDPYGPGGFLYNAGCQSFGAAMCAGPDSLRSANNDVLPSCLAGLILWDAGRLYGASIIDSYTTANDSGGLDILWNVSTWNPYAVVLMKTTIALPQ